MRTFTDDQGRRWQAALLEGSYGTILLTFNPFDGDSISQITMNAETMVDASDQLRELDEDGLRGMLAQARPWDNSMGIFSRPVANNG